MRSINPLDPLDSLKRDWQDLWPAQRILYRILIAVIIVMGLFWITKEPSMDRFLVKDRDKMAVLMDRDFDDITDDAVSMATNNDAKVIPNNPKYSSYIKHTKNQTNRKHKHRTHKQHKT